MGCEIDIETSQYATACENNTRLNSISPNKIQINLHRQEEQYKKSVPRSQWYNKSYIEALLTLKH